MGPVWENYPAVNLSWTADARYWQRLLTWKRNTSMSRAELARFRLQNIGFYFSEFLFPALTAAENIELVLNVKGMRRRAAKSSASLAGTSWVRDIKRIKTW